MSEFNLKTAIPLIKNSDGLYERPMFDLATARPTTVEEVENEMTKLTGIAQTTPVKTDWNLLRKAVAEKEIPRLQKELQTVEEQGYFDRADSYSRTEEWEKQKDNIQRSISIYQGALKRLEKEPGFLEELWSGVSETLSAPEKLAPFSGSIKATVELVDAMNAANKAEAGETLSGGEQALLDRYRAQSIEDKRGMGYNVGKMVGEMPTFIAEFVMLSPIRQAIQKPIYETVRQGLNRTLSKVVSVSIGAAAQGMANLPEIGERTADYLIPNAEQLEHPDITKLLADEKDISFSTALSKAIGTTVVDYVTEYAGGLLTKPMKFLKASTLAKWAAIHGFKTPGALAKAFKTAGWNGVVGEVFEEELAEVFQAPIEGRPFKAPLFTPEGTERLLTETLGITAFGGLAQAGYMALDTPGRIAERIEQKHRLAEIATQAIAEYYYKNRQAEGGIYFLRTNGKTAPSTIPDIGETISFTNEEGITKTGEIIDIVGNTAHIDIDGHTIVEPLTHLYRGEQPMAGGITHPYELEPIFYSKMAASLAEKMPENASVEQVRGIIRNAQISLEEIQWSGIEDFFKGKDKVNKLELLDYLQENRLTIEETMKGEQPVAIDVTKYPEAKVLQESGWTIETNDEEGPGYSPILFRDVENGDMMTSVELKAFIDRGEYTDPGGRIYAAMKSVEDKYRRMELPEGQTAPKLDWRPYAVAGAKSIIEPGGWKITQIPSENVEGDKFIITKPNGSSLSPGDYWDTIESAKSRAELEAASALKPTKYSKWIVPGGKNYREMLLQLPSKLQTTMVAKKVGGGARHNFAGLEREYLRCPVGKKGQWEGVGYKLSWEEFSKRVTQKTFNALKFLEGSRNVVWTEAYVFPYEVQRMGTHHTQKFVVNGVGQSLTGGMHAPYQYVRNPGQITGPGSTRVYVDGKGYSLTEVLPDQQTVIPEYDQNRPGTTTVMVKQTKPSIEFTGGHWDEKNVFAHVRMTDRIGPNGEKILFVEEFQSDWMLALRRGQTRAPHHPAVERWLEIALKRVLRYAAENGYDMVSWATGAQTQDHYNLAKYIDKIHYIRHGVDDTEVEIIKNDQILESKDMNDKKLDDYFGKEIAERIRNNEGRQMTRKEFPKYYGTTKEYEDTRVIEGENLKVGGFWAINLYDKQIPNWLNDYAKKFGAQVKAVEINVVNKPTKEDLRSRFNLEFDELRKYNLEPEISPEGNTIGFYDSNGDLVLADEMDVGQGIPKRVIEGAKRIVNFYERELSGRVTQQSLAITPRMKQALLGEGQPIFGKMTKETGVPQLEFKGIKIFRMDEAVNIFNTRGEIVNLPKGEEYRVLPVYDSEGNLVPNKVRLQDGKQLTVYTGELTKLKGKMLGEGEQPKAGGLTHPRPLTKADFNQQEEPLPEDQILVDQELIDKMNEMQDILQTRLAVSSGYRTEKYNKNLKKRGYTPAEKSVHLQGKAADVDWRATGISQEDIVAAAQQVGLNVEDTSLTPKHVHMELASAKESPTKLIPTGEGKVPPAKPPKTAVAAGPEGEETPKPRQAQHKEEMVLLNTPDITSQLLESEREFLKKYLDEGKTLAQIAKELGEDIEDVKKTEMWTYAHLQEIADDMREEMEKAVNEEEQGRKRPLKSFLTGKLKPGLRQKGEYSKLKFLPWLWAKEGEGTTPDTLTELNGMGFPIENDNDVIALIESYFNDEIEARAGRTPSKAQKRGLGLGKPKKMKPAKPERAITGIGNGSVISEKEDIDYEERSAIFRNMPFSLLGNKAEVLSRLTKALKNALRLGVAKVYDLWGGAKGYRAGLFPGIPAADYNFNELTDERYNYAKNVKDPEKQKVMKTALAKIMTDFTAVMENAFGLPKAKDDADALEMMNTWLKLGLQRERYYFAKEVIEEFWDILKTEAAADKYVSPESSAKYFFLETFDVYQAQGIVRKEKGHAYIEDILSRLVDLQDKFDIELKRDQGMPVTQQDAWEAMDKLVQDLNAGTVNAKETVVLVDPQYLNPTEEAGTYTVGSEDNTWEGHKKNLEAHLLPLVKTGVKIIYTNNAEPELIKWLRAHKLPYNIEKSVRAVAERRGRDEIISLIGFSLGPEWTMGPLQPTGEKATGPGELYVAERVTGQSERFTEWLKKEEEKRQAEIKKQELIAKIERIRSTMSLSKITVSRIKKFLGIREMKNTGIPALQKVIEYLSVLKGGDRLLSDNEINVLKKLMGDIKDIEVMPKRIAILKFGINKDILGGRIMKHIPLEFIPAVDIKEGNPIVANLMNEADDTLSKAHTNVQGTDNAFDKLLKIAEKARNALLSTAERIRRAFTRGNDEIFKALGGEAVDLLPEEKDVVKYLQDYFEAAKERPGLLKKYRMNYVTHLEQPLAEKILKHGIIGAIQQYIKEQAAKEELDTNILVELENVIGSTKFFRFALQRKGGIEPTTNLRKILHEYSSLLETKIALDQILPIGQMMTTTLLKGQNALFIKRYMQNLKGRGLDHAFRTGRAAWLPKLADNIIDLSYLKLLGLPGGIWSGMKNLIAGEANSLILTGFKQYLTGKQRFLSNPKKAYRLAVTHGLLEGTYADYAQKALQMFRAITRADLIHQKLGEIEIRTCLFVSELTPEEWNTEIISPARYRKFKNDIAKTQSIFSRAESPLFAQTWYGRMILQMIRWRITNAMLLRRTIMDAVNAKKTGDQAGFKKAMRIISYEFIIWGIAEYLSFQLFRAGLAKWAKVAESAGQVVQNMIEIFTLGPIVDAITDNPVLSTMKELAYSIQAIANYLRIPGIEEPSNIEINKGIEETYIAPLKGIQSAIDNINNLIEESE